MCLVYMCMYYLIVMYVFLFKLTILIQNWHNDALTTCLWHLNRWHFVKSSNVMQNMIHGSLQLFFFSFLFFYTPLSLGVFIVSWIIHIMVCLLPCFVGVPSYTPLSHGFFCHLIHNTVHLFCVLLFLVVLFLIFLSLQCSFVI